MEHHLIYKVPDYKKLKKRLINLIYKIPNNSIKGNCFDRISHTDWDLPRKMKREYADFVKENIIKNYGKNLLDKFKFKRFKMQDMWFQIYKENDRHGLHTHAHSHFTNVFYVQLPNKNVKTRIISVGGEELDLNVEEGDILTFPSFYTHESPENKNKEEKIIISFNIDIFYNFE